MHFFPQLVERAGEKPCPGFIQLTKEVKVSWVHPHISVTICQQERGDDAWVGTGL